MTAHALQLLRKHRWLAWLGTAVLLWLVVSWFVAGYLNHRAHGEMIAAARLSTATRVQTIAKVMDQSIADLKGIAAYVAQEPEIVTGLLRTRPAPADSTPEQRRQTWSSDPALAPLNQHLAQAARHLGADVVWVINREGHAIAASNVTSATSFVGTAYLDRTYFRTAITGVPGHQYAVGRKTNIPGLYFSAPIRAAAGEIIGVAVVKIDLPRLAYWVNQADAFVSDEFDVVILTRDSPEMRALVMRALPGARVAGLSAAERQARYKRSDFPALALTAWDLPRHPGVAALEQAPVVMARQEIADLGLQVHVLERLPALADVAVQQMQRFLPLAAGGSLLLLIVGGSVIFGLQRRQSERHLAASLSLHQATIESTSDGILVVDHTTRQVTTWNRRFADLWHVPPDLLAARCDRDLLTFVSEQLVSPQGFMPGVEEIYRHPEKPSFDVLHFRDGRVFERHSNPQRLGSTVVGRVWNFRDVTLRNRALEQLAQNELELQTIIDTEPECVKLIAADGTLLKMNRAGLDMIEADSPKQVLGKKVLGIIAPEYRGAFSELTARVFAGESGKLEFEIVGLKGGRRWLDTHAVPLLDTHGNIIALLGVTRDISARKTSEAERALLQQQLQHAQKLEAIGQLTGGIAHDFNNILGAILGFTGLTLDRYRQELPEKAVDYLNEVQKAGERARDLIQKMLAFARGSGGEAQVLDPRPLLKEVIKMLAATLPSSLELREQLHDDVPAVRIDPVQLHQILTNLVINARDATGGQGRIEVGLRLTRLTGEVCDVCHLPVRGEFVELFVQDNGSGIAAEVLPKIFDPFFTTKDVGRGSGMGLAMVMGILREHDAHALVESTPGVGATFRLFFHPAAGHTPEAISPAAATGAQQSGGQHILVVDDEVPLGRLLGEVLDAHGYGATVHANPRTALEAYKADPGRFAAVITDQTMPGMTGLELVHELLALKPDLPVLMVSGYSEKVDAESAAQHGIRHFFYKPVDSPALLAALREALR